MQATYAVMPGEFDLRLEQEELDPDSCGRSMILLRAEASVVSAGTELAIYRGIAPGVHTPGNWNAYPWRPGYGVIGYVDAVGSSVERLRVGDRIFAFGRHASHQFYDVSEDKPFQSAFVVDDTLPEQNILLRLALIALAGVQLAPVAAGDTVAVFGLGLVGNLTAQLYRLSGARVIALDPCGERCDRARRVGIDRVVSVTQNEQIECLLEMTEGDGVDVAVDAVGHSAVIRSCASVCAPRGHVVLLGSPRLPYEYDATETFRMIHNRRLTVHGALEWRFSPRSPSGTSVSIETNLRRLIEMAQRKDLLIDPLITHRIDPDQMAGVYREMANGTDSVLGVIVRWPR